MAKRRRWPWVAGLIVVVALGAGAAVLLVRDPLRLPGEHDVDVYAVDDAVSEQVTEPPGFVGRALGMCDADTYYAEDGDRKLCLVLNGPLGQVRATRSSGQVKVAADQVAKLRSMAAQDTGTPQPTTRLVLMSGGPAALVAVADLAGDAAVSVPALG
ncbi:hypothetical protein ODJ79_35185 [Actinoplanes sp. KI2]|uniref:hypothetical protein n=1 Tax=Actinoplanes sp. KI2 TaxID=2983315 RepID=UPI0021D5FB18|nr:hypothetical protein [Actinoplanes sp. KI2]MCU7728986.1 hypothetical protein [Actinoplanes sp. KI2]